MEITSFTVPKTHREGGALPLSDRGTRNDPKVSAKHQPNCLAQFLRIRNLNVVLPSSSAQGFTLR